MNQNSSYYFLLGGNDAEMEAIRGLLDDHMHGVERLLAREFLGSLRCHWQTGPYLCKHGQNTNGIRRFVFFA